MSRETNAELIWFRQHGAVTPVYVGNRRPPFKGAWLASAKFAHVDGRWPILQTLPEGIVYRAPTKLAASGKDIQIVGEVYAILAYEGKDGFTGARLNFRDVIDAGRQAGVFVYVIPTTGVTSQAFWQGYVRLGYRRWLPLLGSASTSRLQSHSHTRFGGAGEHGTGAADARRIGHPHVQSVLLSQVAYL
ncbi:hypothetical protein GCM10025858_36100 [Alicyclobacillus sacchari]|uniref:hypothetical protein n=1 Tax=Alicyclobacillus sacchari TaxID=392010 RepID=UPI0023E99992|nr:hypothetical protein [Alicyclobacillus sacchari]GMA59107.1 hypothetical protein GCM10025858_36100 [Alicyclobacillus sacchari]